MTKCPHCCSWSDDPEMDMTDAAHPAWWRGQEDGVRGVVGALGGVLRSGKFGEYGSPALNLLATKIDEMRSLILRAAKDVPRLIQPERLNRDCYDFVQKYEIGG